MLRDAQKIARTLDPTATEVSVRPLVGGVSADTFAVRFSTRGATRTVTVRRGRSGAAIDAQREFRLLTDLTAINLRVPAPLLLDLDGSICGVPGIVMEFVEGTTTMPRPLNSSLDAMAGFLAELHGLDALDFQWPEREDPIQTMLQSPVVDQISVELKSRLEEHGAFTSRNRHCLLHGDFWPNNVIWNGTGIASVIDWEDAAIGDPLCDIAGAQLELTWAFGEEAAAHFCEAYLDRMDVDLGDLPIWQAFVTSASLAHMDHWGLASDDLEQRRMVAKRLLSRAEERYTGTA